ncbi:amino acid adenylation domain-containing protein [Streptomyces sp. NPDC051555]|uniref:amino acid adenylation domain-containing protein n=1 Tax=Streptomyces sp. NPDC051555 TaxID=3365657 RepID=UPI0037A3AA6D
MFELSPSQEIVWLHEQMSPGSHAYNFTATIDLWGPLDEEALVDALAETFARHRGLRLELVPGDPGDLPRQRVNEHAGPRVGRADVSGHTDPEGAFAELLRAEADRPFELTEAPLMRWLLVRLTARHHRIVHVEHHLIHDGHSFTTLLHDVFTGYRTRLLPGPRPDAEPTHRPMPRAARSYEEHLDGITGPGAGERRAAGLEFWREQLAGAAFDLPLPGLARPGVRRRHAGAQLRQAVGADLADRLRARSRAEGHTVFTTLMALFAELLRRHSGRADLVVGTAVGNRPEGHEKTIGMFVNTIPVRLRPDPGAPARDLVDAVTDTLIRCLPHQQLPVQELTRDLGLHTDGADNPLFSVMFSAHDAPLPRIDLPELEIALFEGFNTGTTRFDLDVVLLPDDRRTLGGSGGQRPGAAGMTLVWDYDRDLFAGDTVALLAERFLALLRAYLAEPGAALAALAPTAPAPVPADDPAPDPAADLPDLPDLAHLLAGHPRGATALVAGARSLTYAALDHEVAALAERLRAAGVTAGMPVAAVLPRGVDAVVTLLACLRTGAVYCPLSPADPAARLEALLARLRPALVLTTRESPAGLPAGGFPLALLDDPSGSGCAPDFPDARAAALVEGAAYVIHTSGSTGLPKPVVVGRGALAHHAAAVAERFALTADDRVLLFAQPSFDVALEEVLPALLAGACLVLPHREVPTGAELGAVLAARRITVANLPTSYLLAVREELCAVLAEGLWTPRLLVVGGERLPAASLAPLFAAADGAGTGSVTVLNAYGVTEATITSTVQEVTAEDLAEGGEVALGTPLPGVTVHVLDGSGRYPLPPGAVGELAIGGAGLADGYRGDDGATAERFVTVAALGGARVYLTGDLGHQDRAGRLRFLGRRDHQVKLRGYRIELEEVEAAASAELAGRPCAVVLDPGPPAGPRLVGFVRAGAEAVDQAGLHRALGARLPAALVPGQWLELDAIPVLAGGKPDRVRLARLAAEAGRARASEAAQAQARAGRTAGPDDPVLEVLGDGWRYVLGHDRFTPSSHFFQVGGHSLLVAQLSAWLAPRLGHRRPPLHVLLRHPVLTDQAEALRKFDAEARR